MYGPPMAACIASGSTPRARIQPEVALVPASRRAAVQISWTLQRQPQRKDRDFGLRTADDIDDSGGVRRPNAGMAPGWNPARPACRARCALVARDGFSRSTAASISE